MSGGAWVLGWGGLLALGQSLGYFLWGSTQHWLDYVSFVSLDLIGGFCLGWCYWQAAEREYQTGVGQGPPRG